MDRGDWQAIIHGVTKSRTWLSKFHTHKMPRVEVCDLGERPRVQNCCYALGSVCPIQLFLVMCMCAKSIQLCPTLCDHKTAACQAPLSMEFSRQGYWSGFPCSPPGNLPYPGIKPVSLISPALASRFFTTGKSCFWSYHMPKYLKGTQESLKQLHIISQQCGLHLKET